MFHTAANTFEQGTAAAQPFFPFAGETPRARELTDEAQAEVIAFLSRRPLHTFNLLGFILNNGLVSPLNRGTFYAYRDEKGRLEGVALIGHVTLFEACTDRAVAAFALLARGCAGKHILLGEQEKVALFWSHYERGGQPARLACREWLLESRGRARAREEIPGLHRAAPEDLELVMPVQAQLAFEESQINPLEKDPAGFRARCARRIEQGRTWAWIEGGRLIFKADILNETSEVTYLEGVWVNPQDRGKGLGLRCMAQLGRTFLRRVRLITLFVNVNNQEALGFYRAAGYETRGCYDTIFF
ncbi:MAG: GNAT family N-acetyltransferase [Acidobacteria bacterium]|nr:GNAT family N-acetyltransferase [Acidobacteriota bacterium]MCA1641092.1 GNAT family N-acetyltransferase [Acidobacteriota bacterium]